MLLPDTAHLRLEAIVAAPNAQALTLVLASTQTAASCPMCGTVTTHIHSRYTRTVFDLPWAGMLVQLRLQVDRFFCNARNCIRTIFTERLPQVLAPRARRTHRLATAQQRIGLALGGAAGERLAEELAHLAGIDTLPDAVRQAPIPPAPPPTKIGIDDWAKRKGQSYATIVVDLETHQPIDLLEERSSECVAQWLQEHPDVEIISRNPSGSRLTRDPSERPPTLRNLTWSIIRRPDWREEHEQEQVDQLRQLAGDLDTVVTLAEDFAVILREQRGEELEGWLERAHASGIRVIRNFATGLRQDYAAVKNVRYESIRVANASAIACSSLQH